MKLLLTAASVAALSLFASAAYAGDWDGFYAGGQLGANSLAPHTHGGGYIPSVLPSRPSPSVHFNGSLGVDAGGFAGYNWQWDRWVAGLEGDVAYLGNNRNEPCGYFMCRFKQNWDASIVARGGYVENNVLFYVKAGVAFSQFKATFTDDPYFSYHDSNSPAGFTFGGGVDAKLCPNMFGGVSVQYSNYGDHRYDLYYVDPVAAPTTVSVTARVAWMFGPTD